MNDDLSTEGTAAARPEDYVREFMEQLEHSETRLHTDTRRDADDVWVGTNWGEAGRAAILGALRSSDEVRLWRAGKRILALEELALKLLRDLDVELGPKVVDVNWPTLRDFRDLGR